MSINKISIKNFKVFKDKTEFELAPITLLTGPNNSGKSSFTKFLDLLSSNYKNPSGFSVLDFIKGKHQLGEFNNIINWDSNSELLSFELDFPLSYFDENFKIQFNYSSYQENGVLHSFKIYNKKRTLLDVHKIESDNEIHGKGQFFSQGNSQLRWCIKLDVNYIKETINTYRKEDKNTKNLLFEYISDKEIYNNSNNLDLLYSIEELIFNNEDIDISFYSNLNENHVINFFNKSVDQENWLGKFELKNLANNIDMQIIHMEWLENVLIENNLYEKYVNLNLTFISESDEVAKIFDEIFTNNIYKGLQSLNNQFSSFSFLSATRGNKDRIFLNDSNHEINLLIREFNKFVNIKSSYFIFLKESFIILGIKGVLKIKRVESFGTLLYVEQKNRDVLLSDLGYGLSQVIPILLKILIESDKIFKAQDDRWDSEGYVKPWEEIAKKIFPTITIEEPEANLHPKLQSKLADIFVLAYKTFGVHFIIETHSEYLIRKLQYLTAKEELTTNESVIYYFNDDEYVSKQEKKVKKIEINKFGGLTDTFGPGFYDEATTLQFELLKLNKERNN
jgi:predicted ATPase